MTPAIKCLILLAVVALLFVTEMIPLAMTAVISYGTPSGTRTLDTLIKSQVLYQLS